MIEWRRSLFSVGAVLVASLLSVSVTLAQSTERISLQEDSVSLPVPPGWNTAPEEFVAQVRQAFSEAAGSPSGLAAILSPSTSESWTALPYVLVFADQDTYESLSEVQLSLAITGVSETSEKKWNQLENFGAEISTASDPFWDESLEMAWLLATGTDPFLGQVMAHNGVMFSRDGGFQVEYNDSPSMDAVPAVELVKEMLSDLQVPAGRSLGKPSIQ